jgi:aminoglycoside phosphotransferase (APT) family kinase protein
MPTPWQRDLEADGKKLESWLCRRIPAASDLRMSPLVSPKTSGFSNETLLCDVEWTEDGERRKEPLVVRIQPIGYQVFLEYDLGLQFRTMERLAASDVPVPRVLWLEEQDDGIFGAPFYVMRKVEGRVPTDNPPYHMGGWLHDVTPEERRAIWLASFDCMARIHRLDVDATGMGSLRRPELGSNGLDQELAYYRRYLEWASGGREQPVIEAALEWLEKNRPSDEPEGLVWGDARMGNIIYDGAEPAAVLDWEMVTVGSPEKDVAWAMFVDWHHSEGVGAPRLAGFPSDEETLAFYADRSGHEVRNLHYYKVFAAADGPLRGDVTRAIPRIRAEQHRHAAHGEAPRSAPARVARRRWKANLRVVGAAAAPIHSEALPGLRRCPRAPRLAAQDLRVGDALEHAPVATSARMRSWSARSSRFGLRFQVAGFQVNWRRSTPST